MKELNNKGFTLVEVIAVVVIIAVLAILLVPSVSSLLNRGGNEAYEGLKDSILVAAKEYVNDNRYDIVLDGNGVDKIGDKDLVPNGQIYISILLEKGYLSPSGTGCGGASEVMTDDCEYIVDPRDKNKKLDLNDSYVGVKFNSTKKDYELELIDKYLIWK